MSTGPGLESLVDQTISVITNDGHSLIFNEILTNTIAPLLSLLRNVQGVLKGFDQATNIILDESHERVYSTKEGVQQLVLGLYIIRGDNISVVGELDEELDSALDLSNLRAHPLKPFENEQGDRRNERGIETLRRGGGGGVVVERECVEMAEEIVEEDVRKECKKKFKKFL
ncbi:hypothetical protein J1N35_023580 [Gossypium stocksii]|uniref:U6 snRNA-associated Sm-like protein LSm8 n=1 Tax=Gossypium stocksii TaxID=47602 RepID=A0A9D3VJS8_9ROSI|nr:hypothetical protein J1N35_023580 [Gossypium stocksii]